jgi:hypothetical protein
MPWVNRFYIAELVRKKYNVFKGGFMIRSIFIQQLADFLDTFPEGCSNYHICDMLIRRAEKMGMSPPIADKTFVVNNFKSIYGNWEGGTFHYTRAVSEWEDEDCGEFENDWTWEDEE